VLARPRARVAGTSRPDPKAAPPQGAGLAAYRDLGRHLLGEGMQAPSPYLWLAVPVVALLVLGLLAIGTVRRAPPGPANVRATLAGASPEATGPLLFASDRGVAAGETLESSAGAPLRVTSRIPENSMALAGKLRVVSLAPIPSSPRNFVLRAVLASGSLKLDLKRGRSEVQIEGGGVTLRLIQGRARLEADGPLLRAAVYHGSLQTLPPAGEPPAVIGAGRKALFRNGFLQGRLLLLDQTQEPW
jgi:hypothetical protein